jgi:predicted SprT family Zn-dependent metalloprotease
MLGYFDPNFYELGFHECLMHSNRELLQNIIKHELAHYITFINYGDTVEPHTWG